jgi:hypothetical protein
LEINYPGRIQSIVFSFLFQIFEKIQPELHTDGEGVAKYKGSPFVVVGKDGYFRAQTMKNSGIK